ncbi:hypothetical protein SteCoe_40446 [Stentor coeruleus]|uniref:Uncharacterized protein n=1 Tax=Stentor coeruleus TaxID=5963 RepID=A0A1R2AKK8_9CILI|nr:hypothetical protein SteCoe_40446 [Stentor coeruleus]
MDLFTNYSKTLPTLRDFWPIFSYEIACKEDLMNKGTLLKRERFPLCRKTSLKLQHFTVNHTKYYVYPDTGAITNAIEGTRNTDNLWQKE